MEYLNNLNIDDNQSQQVPEPPKIDKPVKTKRNLKKVILFSVLAVLLIGGIVGGMYWWQASSVSSAKKQYDTDLAARDKTIQELRQQILALNQTDNDTSGSSANQCTTVSSSQSENIKASITSGNTQPLEGYMASTVNVIFAATEGIGPTTPTSAVSNITNFISDATSPWNFALPSATLTSYRQSQGYTSYFPTTAIVGRSANKKVISFSFNCSAKISTVFMAISENLLLQ